VPRNVTNANQVITFDDNLPLTVLAPLPLSNVTGGIIQALLVFKGVSNIYQITGDSALSSLAKNALNVATGTLAPNSIANTPKGVMFIAPDGLRIINFQANVSDPIGYDGMGKALPFLYAIVPSRMAAASNGSVYRISVQDGSRNGTPFVEYWFDHVRNVWSGPHTFPADLIAVYANTFIVASHNVRGSLWQSDYVQSGTSAFIENNAQLTFAYATAMLPDPNVMAENAMIESTIYMTMDTAQSYFVQSLNQDGTLISSCAIINPAQQETLWGGFFWGDGSLWGGAQAALYPRRMAWPIPVVFRRMQIVVTGNSGAQLRIGTLHLRYETLGYLQQAA